MATFPQQETTSVYFNSIIRKDVSSLTVDELPTEAINDFNDKVRMSFPEDADVVIRRVRYLITYILQSINWKEYGSSLEAWQLQY